MLILGASPRAGGNCDAIIQKLQPFLQQQLNEIAKKNEQGADEQRNSSVTVRCLQMRDFDVTPCHSCGSCNLTGEGYVPPSYENAYHCPLASKDNSLPLLQAVASCKALCIVAPIYFYHLPAGFKALLDRLQPFWNASMANAFAPSFAHKRLCHTILVAGRQKGEQLFAGSLLTLRYAFRPLLMHVAEPLLLRGIEAKGCFAFDEEAIGRVLSYGADIMQQEANKD